MSLGLRTGTDLSSFVYTGTRSTHASLCAACDRFSAEADEAHTVRALADQLENADRGTDRNSDHPLAEPGHRHWYPAAVITLQN